MMSGIGFKIMQGQGMGNEMKQDWIGQMLRTTEAESWVRRSSLYCFPYAHLCLKLCIIKSQNKTKQKSPHLLENV